MKQLEIEKKFKKTFSADHLYMTRLGAGYLPIFDLRGRTRDLIPIGRAKIIERNVIKGRPTRRVILSAIWPPDAIRKIKEKTRLLRSKWVAYIEFYVSWPFTTLERDGVDAELAYMSILIHKGIDAKELAEQIRNH